MGYWVSKCFFCAVIIKQCYTKLSLHENSRAFFIISQKLITLIRKNLTYEFGLRKGDVKLECHNEKCPDEFSPPCSINGYVGIIDDLVKNDRQSYIVIFTEDNETPLFVDVKYEYFWSIKWAF